MPLYMDRHDAVPDQAVTPEDVAGAHLKDLEVQARHGVRYISYWFDPANQNIFCLAEAPSREAAEAVHREAHGLMASRVIEVDPMRLKDFLGEISEPEPGSPHTAAALRTILFTDMEGSTSLTQKIGDARAMEILRAHDGILTECLGETRGRAIKHTGDGLMACFASVTGALECSQLIQRKLDGFTVSEGAPAIRVRIGLAAGEPVTQNNDLYGASVQLAARICATADGGMVLASSTVRDLAIGKDFAWDFHGEEELKGFDEAVRLYRLRWS